jgi:hypothetical protein
MTNLKEKAFKICTRWDSTGKTCLEERYALWLEDVEQEIKKVKELGAEAATVMIEGELKDFKQKLQQLLEEFPTIPEGKGDDIWEGLIVNLACWKKKFEELLKEEKEAR